MKMRDIVTMLKEMGLELVASGTEGGQEIYHFLLPRENKVCEILVPVEYGDHESRQTPAVH